MKYITQPEYWLRGMVDGVPALLQPVACGLLQVRAEVNELMADFPEEKLWNRLAGLAAPGFHLQHICGVMDRLFTYARGEALSQTQREWLAGEGKKKTASLEELLDRLNEQVDLVLDQLRNTDERTLTDVRYVGRKQIPATVIALLAHAAEHGMRHTGQLLVTVRVLRQPV